MVVLGIEEVELVFVDAKLDHFTHRQEGRVLRLRRADVIDDVVALQNVLLAKDFLRVLVGRICAKHPARNRFALFFRRATGGRIVLTVLEVSSADSPRLPQLSYE